MADGLDALGVALAGLKLTCSTPALQSLSGPWELALPPVASLHVLVRGSCRVELDAPLWTWGLDRRTLLLARPGVSGRLRSVDPSSEGGAGLVSTELRVAGEDPLGLLRLLPPVLPIDADRIPAPLGFRSTLDALIEEVSAATQGLGFVATRLFEVLFVHALRMHMLEMSWNDRGWFRALIDPLLRRPLEAAAEMPTRALSVCALARAGERSRRRFGGRLRGITGVGAGAFVRSLRLRRARELLATGSSSLDAIAREVGLSSRQVLCRGFRREFGVTPATYWRRVHLRPFPRQPRAAGALPVGSDGAETPRPGPPRAAAAAEPA
jgi:AraC-like DNA-binding protein